MKRWDGVFISRAGIGHIRVTRLLTDEGYVTFSETGAPVYHYYLRDHLGNVRVVMGQTGAVEQVNHYYAFGGLMRESTSPGLQPYKYGGKELDRYAGLDAYDFGARSYFADRMQWSTMDPLCEKYYDVSPYAYCMNNPVKFIDPDGKGLWETYIFALNHPVISLQIGVITQNGTNISSIASRFARIGRTEENINAIRHVMWQAIITHTFGSEIAKEVGDAHEMNPKADLSLRNFYGPKAEAESDQVTDLLNNILGREIGKTFSGNTKSLVSYVLDIFTNEGLYVSEENNSDNSFHVIRKKISQEEKKCYSSDLDSRDENGFTKDEIKRIKMNIQLKDALEMSL